MLANNNKETQKLQNLIGDDAFTRLCTCFGGKPLQISNSEQLHQQLNIIVGKRNADKIICHFNEVELTLPTSSSLEVKKRNQAIIKDSKNGMSCGDIAVKYGMTYHQANRIIHEVSSF